jgi:hypothetical protein
VGSGILVNQNPLPPPPPLPLDPPPPDPDPPGLDDMLLAAALHMLPMLCEKLTALNFSIWPAPIAWRNVELLKREAT